MSGSRADPPLLKVAGLAFAWPSAPDAPVLRDVNIEIGAGESVGLIGDNGCGKTTLFRCLTGLSRADRGEIWLDGQAIKTDKDFRALRRRVGYVLQNSDDQMIFPTVMEDLVFGPLNLGLDENSARARAEEALAATGMTAYADRITWRLSGGEKKLAALAAILALAPDLLLLDEPLNELDDKATARVAEIVKDSRRAKIVVSHDVGFLREVTAKILRLKDGRLIPEP